MFNVGPGEIIIVALVLLMAVGPEQLPGVIRRVGKAVSQARSMTDGLRADFMAGMDEIERATDPESWASSAGPTGDEKPPKKQTDVMDSVSDGPTADVSDDVSDGPESDTAADAAPTEPERDDVSGEPAVDASNGISDEPAVDVSDDVSNEPAHDRAPSTNGSANGASSASEVVEAVEVDVDEEEQA